MTEFFDITYSIHNILIQPLTLIIVSALVVIYFAYKFQPFRFITANLEHMIRKQVGYGSCMQCGNKRESMWLLTCNSCYIKKFPEQAKNFTQRKSGEERKEA